MPQHEPTSDKCLRFIEIVTVILLFGLFLSVIGYELWWVVYTPGQRQDRLATVLKAMNENWKVGLLVLIPLFYRAVRKFLLNLKSVGSLVCHSPSEEPPGPQGKIPDQARP